MNIEKSSPKIKEKGRNIYKKILMLFSEQKMRETTAIRRKVNSQRKIQMQKETKKR